jgi:hypothetical protein
MGRPVGDHGLRRECRPISHQAPPRGDMPPCRRGPFPKVNTPGGPFRIGLLPHRLNAGLRLSGPGPRAGFGPMMRMAGRLSAIRPSTVRSPGWIARSSTALLTMAPGVARTELDRRTTAGSSTRAQTIESWQGNRPDIDRAFSAPAQSGASPTVYLIRGEAVRRACGGGRQSEVVTV